MLNGNKLVILLPLVMMGFIFFGGYQYLKESEGITNAELYEVVKLNADVLQLKDSLEITGDWIWEEMPIEGLAGDDYLGIILEDSETGQFVDGDLVKEAVLQLTYGEKVIYETEGTVVDNGVIFPFLNKIEEHESFGNKGLFSVKYQISGLKSPKATVALLHTWKDHKGLIIEDARMFSPQFKEPMEDAHWVMDWVFE